MSSTGLPCTAITSASYPGLQGLANLMLPRRVVRAPFSRSALSTSRGFIPYCTIKLELSCLGAMGKRPDVGAHRHGHAVGELAAKLLGM